VVLKGARGIAGRRHSGLGHGDSSTQVGSAACQRVATGDGCTWLPVHGLVLPFPDSDSESRPPLQQSWGTVGGCCQWIVLGPSSTRLLGSGWDVTPTQTRTLSLSHGHCQVLRDCQEPPWRPGLRVSVVWARAACASGPPESTGLAWGSASGPLPPNRGRPSSPSRSVCSHGTSVARVYL
jgi:hypothetical protein